MGLQYEVTVGELTKMYRKKGSRVELIEPNQDVYSLIPVGYYHLKLTGISEPFEGGFGTCVRLEWKVMAAMKPSGQPFVGHRFVDIVSFRIGEKSNFGMAIAAMTGGAEIVDGDATDFIGGELEGPVNHKVKGDRTYNKIAYESVTAVGAEEAEEEEVPAPPKKTKAAATAPARNPLTDEDDDEDEA